jgi:hypothetical protein
MWGAQAGQGKKFAAGRLRENKSTESNYFKIQYCQAQKF